MVVNFSAGDALRFVAEEQAFRLGSLLTESSHPKTADFSKVVAGSLRRESSNCSTLTENCPRARR